MTLLFSLTDVFLMAVLKCVCFFLAVRPQLDIDTLLAHSLSLLQYTFVRVPSRRKEQSEWKRLNGKNEETF